MSAQPPKRRKTSPPTTTPIFGRTDGAASAGRASYMSPTRASLSRFNSALLPQAQSRSMSAGPMPMAQGGNATNAAMTPDQFIQRGQEALNNIMGDFNARMQKMFAGATAGNSPLVNSPLAVNAPMILSPSIFGRQVGTAPITPSGLETDEQMEAMRAEIRARKAREAQERSGFQRVLSSEPARRTPKNAGRGPVAALIRTPQLQLVPDEDTDELSLEIGRNEDIMARSRPGSARSSMTPHSAIRSAAHIASRPSEAAEDMEIDPIIDEELEIDELSPDAPKQMAPPAGTQQSLMVSPPKRPIGWSKKVQAEDEDNLPDTPEAVRRQLEADDHPRRGVLFSSPSKRRSGQSTPKKRLPPVPVAKMVEQSPAVIKEKPTEQRAAPAQSAMPELPTAPDPKVLAKREEKAKLEKELLDLTDEIMQFESCTKTFADDSEVTEQVMQRAISLLNASNTTKTLQPEPSLSSLLTSFLPFSIPIAQPTEKTKEEDQHFPSHAPLKEDNPLPLNSLFTPLNITSTFVGIPVSISDSDRVSQKHSLLLESPGRMLSCALDLTISSCPAKDSIPTIEMIEVTDLSCWAQPEIGPWINKRSHERDVAAIGYGLGRFWELNVTRAKCWISICKKFPHLASLNGTEATFDIDVDLANLSKKQLLHHLGRSSLSLKSDDAALHISWKLQFDWTGDVESAVTVETALPKSWHEQDTTNALRKIPKTFDVLMRENGVVKAVEVIVGLVFVS